MRNLRTPLVNSTCIIVRLQITYVRTSSTVQYWRYSKTLRFFFLRNLGQSEGLMFLTLGYKKTSFRCHMTSFRCLMSRFQVLGSYKRVSYKKKPECMTFRRHFGLRGQTIFCGLFCSNKLYYDEKQEGM